MLILQEKIQVLLLIALKFIDYEIIIKAKSQTISRYSWGLTFKFPLLKKRPRNRKGHYLSGITWNKKNAIWNNYRNFTSWGTLNENSFIYQ